jgi:AAA+ superfamily predicted ATPase
MPTTHAINSEPLPYANSLEYIKDYLTLLSLQLHREVIMTRALRGDDRQESFLGLFISEQDIGAILSELQGQVVEQAPQADALSTRIEAQESHIEQKLAHTTSLLSWQRLQQIFSLEQEHINILLIALAPEIDDRFAKVYAYLHDDVSRKNPSGALIEKLFVSHDLSASNTRLALHTDSPLLKFALLQWQDNDKTSLLHRGIKLSTRVTHYLLDMNKADESLMPYLQTGWMGAPQLIQDDLALSTLNQAEIWLNNPAPLMLLPEPGADLDIWLNLFCTHAKIGLLSLDWQHLTALPIDQAQPILVAFIREGHLSNSLLHLVGIDEHAKLLRQFLIKLATPLLCLSFNKPPALDEFPITTRPYSIAPMSPDSCVACWQYELDGFPELSVSEIKALVHNYPIGVRNLRAICSNLPTSHSASEFRQQLTQACRQHVSHKMADVAQGVSTPFTFDDLVLPEANLQALRDIIAAQKDSTKVLSEWGLADVFYQSSASAVLFVGPSGTGKTMAANVMANELELDLFRVDLAGVVSKYIGETEKNLDKIFSIAAISKVVLFIDEADALFGKRTEVKDAHDRYANIEVSYLLQKMEQHPGLVILASNLGQNIDEAFSRRFSSIVEFSLPKAPERLALWQKLENTQAPLHDYIDLDFLAQRFEISGGHIRNCILQAAYQAASQNEPIGMQMLIRALSKEYAKLGKPISKNSFGDYYAVIRREANGIG